MSSISSSTTVNTVVQLPVFPLDLASTSSSTVSSQALGKMATEIASIEAIDQLTHLNGVDITEIERRARPGMDSSVGFIGETERFVEVLKKDWETVAKEGKTHIEIADHLEAIILAYKLEGCENEKKKIEYASKMKEFNYTFSYKGQTTRYCVFSKYRYDQLETKRKKEEGAPSLGVVQSSSKEEIILVDEETTMGSQVDLFRQYTNYTPAARLPLEGSWSTSYFITNVRTGDCLRVSGGSVNYIRKYGFYEGGTNEDEMSVLHLSPSHPGMNPFRIDPKKVLCLLSGTPFPSPSRTISTMLSSLTLGCEPNSSSAVALDMTSQTVIANLLTSVVFPCLRDLVIQAAKTNVAMAERTMDLDGYQKYQQAAIEDLKEATDLNQQIQKFNYSMVLEGQTKRYRVQCLLDCHEGFEKMRNMPAVILSDNEFGKLEQAYKKLKKEINIQIKTVYKDKKYRYEMFVQYRKFLREILIKQRVDPESSDVKLKEDAVAKYFRFNCSEETKTYVHLQFAYGFSRSATENSERHLNTLKNQFQELENKYNSAVVSRMVRSMEEAYKQGIQTILVRLKSDEKEKQAEGSPWFTCINAHTKESLEVSEASIEHIRKFGFSSQEGATKVHPIDPRRVLQILSGCVSV